jgi:hypothetical protein
METKSSKNLLVNYKIGYTLKKILILAFLTTCLASCKPTVIYFESSKPVIKPATNEAANTDYWRNVDTVNIHWYNRYVDSLKEEIKR